jgi:hypothetical protein
MGIGSLSGTYRRRGVALTPTHLVSRLKKGYRCTFTPFGALMAVLEMYLLPRSK